MYPWVESQDLWVCPWVESQGLWMCQWVGSQWWEHQSPQVVQLSLKQLDRGVDLKLVTSLYLYNVYMVG